MQTNQLYENVCETLWFAFSSKLWTVGRFCPFLVIGTNVRFASDKRLLCDVGVGGREAFLGALL